MPPVQPAPGETTISDAKTHVDILRQELVGSRVLLEEVAVDGAAGERGAEKEAKEPARARSPC